VKKNSSRIERDDEGENKMQWRRVLCLALLALLVSAPLAAQQQGQPAAAGQQQGQQGQQQGQQGQQQSQPPAQPPQPEPPPVNPEEEADYKAFLDIPRSEIEKQVEAGEAFLKKWPESRGREFIYGRLATIFFSRGDADKAIAYSEKGLALNADNLDMLTIMANVVPRRSVPGSLGFEEKLAKAEQYSNRAIELMATLVKPEALSEEDFNKAKNMKLSMCRSGLGVIYFHKGRFAESAAELEQAVSIVPQPDPTDIFILAAAYENQKRFADAAGAYERCSQIPWSWQERCKQSAATAKKQAAAQPQPPKQQP
jgi:tetratricopeptide (TPR) repeat protein